MHSRNQDQHIIDQLNEALPEDYQVIRKLGGGGQGSVFLGQSDGKQIALKVYYPTIKPERVEREIVLLQGRLSENIVRVLDSFKIKFNDSTYPIIVYEYLDGPDLRNILNNTSTRSSLMDVCLVGFQIASSVELLWGSRPRTVHRDIKPENIVKAGPERYVLVDFGFARHVELPNLTSEGKSPGTPGYKSPEQAIGRRELTKHSDIFSLGVTLFELATGKHPFNRNQASIGTDKPLLLKEHRTNFPNQICDTVQTMMSINPSERGRNVSAQFETILGGL